MKTPAYPANRCGDAYCRVSTETQRRSGLGLEAQRDRIARAQKDFDPKQLALPGIDDAERRQRERDHSHWRTRLVEIEREIEEEPARVRASCEIRASRLEPIGLVYLWPRTN